MKQSPFPNFVVVLSGPAGAGKGTVIQHVLQLCPFLALSISCTTRAKRRGEQEGREYYFLTKAAFEEDIKQGQFLEWARVHDEYYGTRWQELERIQQECKLPLLEVDVQGALELKQKLAESLLIFLMPSTTDELKKRLQQRNTESEAELQQRLARAKEEIQLAKEYDVVVYNDILDDAVKEVVKIVERKRSSTPSR